MTLHNPAMNTLNERRYNYELCLYHTSASRNVVIISIMINVELPEPDADLSGNVAQGALEQILPFQNIKTIKNKVKYKSDLKDWSLTQLLPKKRSFFTYVGSLPYPPFTDQIQWIVFNTPITLQSLTFPAMIKRIWGSPATIPFPLSRKAIDKVNVHYNSGGFGALGSLEGQKLEIKCVPVPEPEEEGQALNQAPDTLWDGQS